ncbi:MAG: hypothetical protein ACK5JF_05975 [Oscillospiraceae bacterium]
MIENDFKYNGPLYLSPALFQEFSGLSRDFIYKGLRDGTIPSIKCGKNFKVNVYAYLRQLRGEDGEQ